MDSLKILTDSELPKKTARPVVFGADKIEQLAKNMFYTMKMHKGIGLAAPQVGVLLRIITVDTTHSGGKFMGIMINPEILTNDSGSDKIEFVEGCLSFPGQSVRTMRDSKITVRYQDFLGNYKTKAFEGIDAICIQHEIDHLNGITMFERGTNG